MPVIYSKTILCPEGQKRAHTHSAGQKSSQRMLKDVSHLSTNTGAFAFVGQELFYYREKGSKSDFWSDLFCWWGTLRLQLKLKEEKKKGFVKNKDPAPLLSQISLGPNRYLEIILTAPLTTASTKSKPQGRSSNTKKSASGWPEWTDLGPSG